MKNKYVKINGLAFSEESDMEKLQKYARKGWILESIVGGFFYKLRKDKPQNIIYNLDYQTEANAEYFAIFKEAGWEIVVSIGNYMHIFSAQAGTKPIYTDCESEIDKYTSIRDLTRKGALYSSILGIPIIGLLVVSLIEINPIYFIFLGLLIIDLFVFVFVFNFMPFLSYNSRIKKLKKDGTRKDKKISNKTWWKINVVFGIIILAFGIIDLINKNYFAILLIISGVIAIVSSYKKYKKYKYPYTNQ